VQAVYANAPAEWESCSVLIECINLLGLPIKGWPQVVRVSMMTSQQNKTSVRLALSAETWRFRQTTSNRGSLI